ncbi:MAG: YabP/YqfC family sporulation protein [Clostridia bacterium]|nr:YabP/YqfC family sporulation protein [Clostridia bacterium]
MQTAKKQSHGWLARIRAAAEQLDVPVGMLRGLPQLTLDGDGQLLVERHRGIVEYGTERIRIAAKEMTVEVLGSGLRLTAMDRDSIRVCGRISAVAFLDRE